MNDQLLEALRLARKELADYAAADVLAQKTGTGVYVRPWDQIGQTLNAIDAAIAATTEATRNQEAIALLQSWLDDESGYDEAAWPVIAEALR